MSSVPSSSSSAEICLLTAGCPIPRSFATAEKLPFSTNRTNICIASNLSILTSVFLYGIDSRQDVTILAIVVRRKNADKRSDLLLLCIPVWNSQYSWIAKSVCHVATSTDHANESSNCSIADQKPQETTLSTLTEKVALITGGSRGIGAAIAKRLAKDGASVAITYTKDADAASAVVKAIERSGGKAIAIQVDAANAEAVKSAVEKAFATFGRLDV